MLTNAKLAHGGRVIRSPDARLPSSSSINPMDRSQVIAKIKSMLALQESTDFDGEASAAAAMIDKLCAKYGITLTEATEVTATDETFHQFKKMDTAYCTLFNAVAKFYDAKAYISRKDGREQHLKLIGSEAQQIQTQLYFEYFYGLMHAEAEKAYQAEKIVGEITGKVISRSFKTNFKKAFVAKVEERLRDLKEQENRVHDDAEAVRKALAGKRFGTRRVSGAAGAGATAGAGVGAGVSLNRQATGGAAVRALAGV